MILRTLTIISFLGLSACSVTPFAGVSLAVGSQKEEFNLDSVELYLAHSKDDEKNFEQFKASGRNFFYECGKILNGKQVAEEQKLTRLTALGSEKLQESSAETYDLLLSKDPKFERPGIIEGAYDPGQFTLSIAANGKKLEVKTNLKAIASSDSGWEFEVRKLARFLREIALGNAQNGKLCQKSEFYDL